MLCSTSSFFSQTVSELLLRVKPSTTNVPPTFPSPTPLLPPSPLHFTTNTTLTHTLTLHDEDTIMGAGVDSISPLPEGLGISGLIITGAYSGKAVWAMMTQCIVFLICSFSCIVSIMLTTCSLSSYPSLSLFSPPSLPPLLSPLILSPFPLSFPSSLPSFLLPSLPFLSFSLPLPFPPPSLSLGEVQLSWSPSEDQEGAHILCLVARNMHSVLSSPLCLPLVVSTEMKEVHIMHYMHWRYSAQQPIRTCMSTHNFSNLAI